jgi:integrase
MPLNLYRRHQKGCKGGHAADSRSGEFEERRKRWKHCGCFIFASGTLAGAYRRKFTGHTGWDDARAKAAQWEALGAWDVSDIPATNVVAAPVVQRTTVLEAATAYLTRCQNRGLEQTTLSKYQGFIKQFLAFCDSKGYVMLDQLTVADMDRFYASWKDGKRSRAKKLERLKSFIRFCLKREWITKDLAEDLQAPEGSSIPANKTPFTDEELNRIYAACDLLGKPTAPGPGHRDWSGEDAKDFILLSIYTGLRISDVATFDVNERLTGNDVFLRMHKTKKQLFTWIPDWLVDRLKARQKTHGSLIFKVGKSLVMRTMTELWRPKLNRVFAIAGPFKERPTPHRFRHTFVRILLEKGVPVADVAELIGDTEEIVRRHYAQWVPERQERLTRILREAFEDKPTPKPKLIAMGGGRS